MEGGFSIVVLGVVGLAVLAMLVVLVLSDRGSGRGSAYDQIGAGGMSRDSEASDWASAPAVSSSAGRTEQEREIRQMLSAKSERLVRNGKPALDIEEELAKLLAPQQGIHDAALVAEVRQLVTARNERRVRQGMDPLDVEAEVKRTLQELNP